MTLANQSFDRESIRLKDTLCNTHPQRDSLHDLCERTLHEMVTRSITTRGEVYESALANFVDSFPHLKPYAYLASQMGMSESALRQKVTDDDRHFTVQEEELFFRLCNFPQGFLMKQSLVFQTPYGREEKK